MRRIIVATRNSHKVGEMRQILGPAVELFSQADFPNAPAAIEDADSFAGNAIKKAGSLLNWLARNSKLEPGTSVLADDSGLEVDALNGAPGIHSARFATTDAAGHENSPDAANNAKLLRLLAEIPESKRTARFRCVLALASPRTTVKLFEGKCEGRILAAASGVKGFGYDPLFAPDGYSQSFAELGEDVKNKISHRARAMAALCEYLKTA